MLVLGPSYFSCSLLSVLCSFSWLFLLLRAWPVIRGLAFNLVYTVVLIVVPTRVFFTGGHCPEIKYFSFLIVVLNKYFCPALQANLKTK